MTRRRDAGFTLMEVLVALVVLSVVVTAVLQLFGAGLRLGRASTDRLEATLLASAKLSEVVLDADAEGAGQGIEGASGEGTEGEYRWSRRVTIEPLPEAAGQAQPDTIRLARVSVEVRWGRNRRVELVTLRASSAKP